MDEANGDLSTLKQQIFRHFGCSSTLFISFGMPIADVGNQAADDVPQCVGTGITFRLF
jgi:hypothetical protein